MKRFVISLFDRFRPSFEEGGKLTTFRPLFDVAEGIILAPKVKTGTAPFIRDAIDIKRYMSMAILAILPSFLSACYLFGPRVLAMVMVSYVVGGLCEVTFAVVRKHEVEEGFLVTGLIFPLVLPPTTPLWVVGVGVLFGTLFGKEVFGGTGRNIFNPALVGRLFITIAFPKIMTTAWRVPFVDGITAATPLTQWKGAGELAPYAELLWGQCAGSAGEVFRVGIIAGGILLMWTRVSNWRTPVSYLGSVFLFAAVGSKFLPNGIAPPLFQLLTGGLLFGAMFMATDPVTSPNTRAGKIISGVACGLLTVLIRSFSGYVEGVMFSIVILNAFAPLIDHIVLAHMRKRRIS